MFLLLRCSSTTRMLRFLLRSTKRTTHLHWTARTSRFLLRLLRSTERTTRHCWTALIDTEDTARLPPLVISEDVALPPPPPPRLDSEYVALPLLGSEDVALLPLPPPLESKGVKSWSDLEGILLPPPPGFEDIVPVPQLDGANIARLPPPFSSEDSAPLPPLLNTEDAVLPTPPPYVARLSSHHGVEIVVPAPQLASSTNVALALQPASAANIASAPPLPSSAIIMPVPQPKACRDSWAAGL